MGVVFVILTVWGFVARDSLGSFLGFSGPLPWSYNIVHLLTAIAALIAGIAVSRLYCDRARATRPRENREIPAGNLVVRGHAEMVGSGADLLQ